MATVRCLVLRAAGINCDVETVHAWQLAGAPTDLVHVNRAMETPTMLKQYQILTIPGGFSYGDDIAAGKVFANQLVHHLGDALLAFVDAGKLVLGICNGFQILVKAGLLAGTSAANACGRRQAVTLTGNLSGKFEDRWVYLKTCTDRCVFLTADVIMPMPIAHAEGRLVAADREALTALNDDGMVALRYTDAEGNPGDYPVNPNGSEDDIAGLTDSTGRALGLMPHPERNVHPAHVPGYITAEPCSGLAVFKNAVEYFA